MNATTKYLTAVAAFSFGLNLGAAEPSYELFDLGALIDPHSYALAINQAGQVAGYGRTARGARAFLYRDQAMQELGPLRATNSYATSINLFGHIAGFADQIEGVRAFVFQDGLLRQFESLSDIDHYAFGINDSGWVVGHFSTADGDEAFVFDGSAVSGLGGLGGSNSYAYAINGRGAIAGSALPAGIQTLHAALWDGGQLFDLNQFVPGSGWELEEARAINDQGLLTGFGWFQGSQHAFRLNGRTLTDLGTLPGATASRGLGLNNRGEVVGSVTIGAGTQTRAFLWSDGRMEDLNDLISGAAGWQLREARGINDAGQIVGWGSFRNEERAFLLLPSQPRDPKAASDPDGDGLPTWWEIRHGLDPFDATGDNGADGDPDGDGVSNLIEYRMGRNPRMIPTIARPISSRATAIRRSPPTKLCAGSWT
jgi:probable HAF family extracellular repeat protein